MKEWDLQNQRHLQAAEGWLELGSPLEANEELEKITPAFRIHPDVLELRHEIYAREFKWDACRDIARALTQVAPDRVSGWLHLSYATRRATNGGLQAAWDILFPVVEKFPNEPTVLYNLACYACQLGNLKEAEAWLHKSYSVGDPQKIKLAALNDADLEPLFNASA
jgi:predicted Zn-dependent protease